MELTDPAAPGTDLDRVAHVLNPRTGEVIDLSAPTGSLAAFLADVREAESMLREAKREVAREIHRRFDLAAKWSTTEDGLKITGQSPAPVEEWDGLELRTALLDLHARGVIELAAVYAAVQAETTWKVRKAGITALRKCGGEVAETIESLCQRSERERRVSVSRVA